MTLYLKNFYSSFEQYSTLASRAFDEGPILKINLTGVNSSSINTETFDPFRQGVEITQDKYARNGLYKISAGTAGHIVQPTCYGVNEINIISDSSYVEVDPFNPVTYLNLTSSLARDRMIGSEDELLSRNYMYNGVLEPLTIRASEAFISNESPFVMHSVKGEFVGGNSDLSTFAAEQVLTVDYTPKRLVAVNGRAGKVAGNIAYENKAWFLDAANVSNAPPGSGSMTGSIKKQLPENGGVKYLLVDLSGTNRSLNVIDPFEDSKKYLTSLGITTATHGSDMVLVFSAMTSSSENYVPPGKKSATTGFIYDNIGYAGTDSITFGGMTY